MRFLPEQEREIRKSGRSKQLACTYVGDHHVTTAYRESPMADPSPPWYYETIIWKNDEDDRHIIDMGSYGHVEGCLKVLRGDTPSDRDWETL